MPPDNSGSLTARTVVRTATLMLAMLVSTVLLGSPDKTEAAITAGTGQSDLAVATPHNMSVTVTPGDNIALFVGIATNDASTDVVTSVTYDGVPLLQLWSKDTTGESQNSSGWILVNPPTGTHTLTTTWTSTPDSGVIWAQEWYGVRQGGTQGTTWRAAFTADDGDSTEPSVTVSNAVEGDMVIDYVTSVCETITPHVSQTQLFVGDNEGGCVEAGASSELATGSTVMSWTQTGTDQWATGAVALIPASGRRAFLKPPNNLGLVGYWSFNEGTGTIATDFSGNGRTGTLNTFAAPPTASSGWTNGKRGKALNFDGSSDYVSTPSYTVTSQGTVALWLKADALAGGTARRFFGVHDDLELLFGENDRFVRADWCVGQDFAGNTELEIGRWYHVVFTWNDATNDRDLYLNGVHDENSPDSITCSESGDLYIGWRSAATGEQFDGILDEVRLYNRELSSTEAAKLYQSGAVKFTTSSVALQQGSTLATGLVGHWTFDGPDTNTTIADRSGQGNHGYFNGGATSSAKVIGKLGQGLNFDGVDDFVSISNFNMSSTFSVAAWVYLRSAVPTGSPQGILSHEDFCYFGVDEDDNLVHWNNGSIGSGIFGVVSSGVWHQVVFTNTGGTLTAYLDGAQSGGVPSARHLIVLGPPQRR